MSFMSCEFQSRIQSSAKRLASCGLSIHNPLSKRRPARGPRHSPESRDGCRTVLLLAGAGGSEISFPGSHRVITLDAYLDVAKGVRRTARIGIVAEAVLRAKLAVNAVEDGGEVLGPVGKKHGDAGGLPECLYGM